jgi:chlorophyll synthase
MWAYACGAVAAGADVLDRTGPLVLGILLAGPLVCGCSQAVNDWFDRHVDAINEPDRVIPSGRMPGRWGLYIAVAMTIISLIIAVVLGKFVFFAASAGLVMAWAYSAPPLRLKQNGWIGNAAVGFSYETLPWLTAMAAALGAAPGMPGILIAVLYGLGAHGIMTLNDFKAIRGDRELGIRTLPVLHGAKAAAWIACAVMALPQIAVVWLLLGWGMPWQAGVVAVLLVAQCACMVRFLGDPERLAVWYSAVGVGLYVSGMMAAALALRGLATAQVSVL